ncbi:hypothetical protein ASD17_01500 [Sphingomonas sp. Root1294]|nr:hypothetical protein ASD17_01500 [Sphingomonas sp. Root1294]
MLFDKFGPYHIARLAGAMPYADVFALEGAPHRRVYDWDASPVPAGMRHAAVAEAAGDESYPARIAARLDRLLGEWQPDAVAVPGWSNMIALAALRWASRRGVPAICMSETNAWDFTRRHGVERVKRAIVRHYGAGLCTSDSHAGYLSALGIPPNRIARGYNVVDNDYFAKSAGYWQAAGSLPAALAERLPPAAFNRYFLTSNRFIEKKNLVRLLAAYAAFREGRGDDPADWPLVLLGDGELRDTLLAERDRLGIGGHVHMPGFLQIDELPKYYGSAGAFLHASTIEQWGLVVNEAMASGLPVAVSDKCGCAEVLIDDGVTGFSFDPLDVPAMAGAMRSLALLERDGPMVAAARRRIADFGPDAFGRGLVEAARMARAGGARPSFLDRRLLDLSIARAAWRDGRRHGG